MTGDLYFFYGDDWKSRVIELGTGGPSHVAMEAPLQSMHTDGIAIQTLWESTTLCRLACMHCGNVTNGDVHCHDIALRCKSYQGRVVRCRIAPECQWPRFIELSLCHELLKYWHGAPYDLRGALESPRHWTRLLGLRHPDLGSVFCSALIARLLMVHNRMNWRNPKWITPAALMDLVLSARTHLEPELCN